MNVETLASSVSTFTDGFIDSIPKRLREVRPLSTLFESCQTASPRPAGEPPNEKRVVGPNWLESTPASAVESGYNPDELNINKPVIRPIRWLGIFIVHSDNASVKQLEKCLLCGHGRRDREKTYNRSPREGVKLLRTTKARTRRERKKDQVQSFDTPERILPHVTVDASEQDDTSLVKASQQGDQEAFALLVRQHQRRVFNLILRLVQDYDEANDLTQDAFFAAWQGLPAFRGEARFSTWLYRIAYHSALQQIERRKREHILNTTLQAEQLDAERGMVQQAAETARQEEQQALVRQQLSLLPGRYRAVLTLRYFQDKTYTEMAALLSLPIGTIKTHLFRARTLLKRRVLAHAAAGADSPLR